MNTQRVNTAAGVILAALQQNRTAAGIALALESAGLLMSPEAAADIAAVSTDAVALLDQAVAELKREHEENARLRARVAELEAERRQWERTAHRLAGEAGLIPREAPVPVAAAEGEHYAVVHHTYRLGHDLPELDGA